VIVVRGLRKSYGDRDAVRGIDLEVTAGEIFSFLGPNGAGKTTTVEILEGFRPRDGGEVGVLGEDPATAGRSWRSRIGVVLQDLQLQPLLTVRESLELYAGYYPSPRPVDDTIELVGLAGQRDQRAGKLSGGQQRRLDVALALVGDPELLFLDEPTTGFDPAARRGAWEVIASLRELGKTVFLTTHYLDEAAALADRVAIIKDGRIVAEGPPSELGGDRAALTRIAFELPPTTTAADLPPALQGRVTASAGGDRLELVTETPVADLAALTAWALERGVDLPGLQVNRPTLEDIYLELTREEVAAK
jgi:ABC-2 type transport system ATP-binding protein